MRLDYLAAGLVLALLASSAAHAAEAQGDSKGLTNPFFPYCVTVPDAKLAELGYTPIPNIYTGFHTEKTPPHDPKLPDRIRALKGTNTVFWLTVNGNRAKEEETDAKAAEILRRLGDAAAEAGVTISVYPHTGNYVATTREGIRLVQKVNHKAVGLTLNLCHELMNDQGPELDKILEEAAPYLMVVTVNGADKKEKGQRMGWDRLIQPLGKGSFDVYAFLRKVKAIGFRGPIGLQCYNLPGAMGGKAGDPMGHLTESARAWKDYSARLAAEEAQHN